MNLHHNQTMNFFFITHKGCLMLPCNPLFPPLPELAPWATTNLFPFTIHWSAVPKAIIESCGIFPFMPAFFHSA